MAYTINMAEDNLLARAIRLPIFSLQKTSLLYISTTLCNNPEILKLIMNYVSLDMRDGLPSRKGYKIVEKEVDKRLKLLELGKFANMILEYIWPVTFEIIQWRSNYAPTIDVTFLDYFYWTSYGKIDSKRTANYIIKNTRLPIAKRFTLACNFCLEKDILEIWENMSNDVRSTLLKQVNIRGNELVRFWICKLQRDKDVLIRNLSDAITCAVEMVYIDAIKYLFRNLYEIVDEACILNCFEFIITKFACKKYLLKGESDICYFFISQMTKKHQEEFLHSNPILVRPLLLYFPGQKEFLNLLRLDLYSENHITCLIQHLFCKIFFGISKDYDYFQLFASMWHILPEETLRKINEDGLMCVLFCSLLSEYFSFVFMNTPRKTAIQRKTSAKIIELNEEKWRLVIFFIENEIVTTESLTNYRPSVIKLLTKKPQNMVWRRLLKFVRDRSLKRRSNV